MVDSALLRARDKRSNAVILRSFPETNSIEQIYSKLIGTISLLNFPELIFTLNKDETMIAVLNMTPESVLLKWVNYHLKSPAGQLDFASFSCHAYLVILHHLNQTSCPLPLPGECIATRVIKNARAIGVTANVLPEDLTKGDALLCALFLAQIFHQSRGIMEPKQGDNMEDEVPVEDTLERPLPVVPEDDIPPHEKEMGLTAGPALAAWCDPAPQHPPTREEECITITTGSCTMAHDHVDDTDPANANADADNAGEATSNIDVQATVNSGVVGEAEAVADVNAEAEAEAEADGTPQTPPDEHPAGADSGPCPEERTLTAWINSLHFDNLYIDSLFDNMEDGVCLLRLMDHVQPGVVNWKKVSLPPVKSKFQKMDNAYYAVTLARSMGLKVINIGLVDLIDGQKKMVLAIISQLMRRYTLKVEYSYV